MKNRTEVITYLTGIIGKDISKFIDFMGYTDIMEELVDATLNDMNDDELSDTFKWFDNMYDTIEEFG